MKFERFQVYRTALPTTFAHAEGTATHQKPKKEKKSLDVVYSGVSQTYLS